MFSTSFICWWLIGYAFALGQVDSKFIGEDKFGGEDWLYNVRTFPPSYFGLIGIFMQFIINGAISEKAQYVVYPVISCALMLFIWPVIVAWIWTKDGWLVTELETEIRDFGFTITVYVFAGTWALIGGAMTGRRIGRFSRIQASPGFTNENQAFYYIGALLTIIGVFTLNNDLQIGKRHLAGGGFGNTWISGSSSSLISLKLLTVFNVDLSTHFTAIYQGFIAGMVIISSSSNCQAWEAAFFGMLAGLVFSLGVKFLIWLRYDDPLNVVSTFLLPGLVGGVLPGFIDNAKGVFWGGWTGHLLAVQVVGTVAVCAWACYWALIVFGILRISGLLVLENEIQRTGLASTSITQKGFRLEGNKEGIEEARY
jgi:Amt family ammonium transporter